jgi:hypothetical protein
MGSSSSDERRGRGDEGSEEEGVDLKIIENFGLVKGDEEEGIAALLLPLFLSCALVFSSSSSSSPFAPPNLPTDYDKQFSNDLGGIINLKIEENFGMAEDDSDW